MDIKLYWSSLKNEIDAETWKSGKCYITEDKAEERAEAQTGNDVLDKNYCIRKIEQGIASVQDFAHKYMTGFVRSTDNVTTGSSASTPSTQSDDDTSGTTSSTTTSSTTTTTVVEKDNKLAVGMSSTSGSYWKISFGNIDTTRQTVDGSLLANSLHKYVVLNVLQEWAKITNPTLTKEYIARQQEEEVRIKSTLYRKEEPNWAE